MTEANQKKIFSHNLSALLAQRRLSQKEVADAIGVIPQTFNRWMQGLSLPRMDKVQKLADYFHIKKSDLIDPQHDSSTHTDRHTTGIKIPILGTVVAGLPIDSEENRIGWEEISDKWAGKGDFYALKVQGDSMQPRIHEGDVLIVKQQTSADSGDLVIALIDGRAETCKRLRRYMDGALELIPENPAYETIKFTPEQVQREDVQIVGVVVENRQKYKNI